MPKDWQTKNNKSICYHNCKWNVTLKNCELLYCTVVPYCTATILSLKIGF